MPRDGNPATAIGSVAVAPCRVRHGAPWLVLALGAAALLAVPYGAILRELAGLWSHDPYYSYGFLIAPWSAWLILGARRRVAAQPVQRDPLGLAVAAAGLAAFASAHALDSLTLAALSLPLVLGGLGRFALGREAFAPLVFPVAFLAFMAPLPPSVVPRLSGVLQQLTAWVTATTLGALGIPFTREGVFIHLRAATVHISEACNGLRFLLAMAVMGVAFAWAVGRGPTARALVVALALGGAIIGNWVRVAGTTALVHVWGPAASLGLFHNLFGKAIYLSIVAAFFLFVLRLRPRS